MVGTLKRWLGITALERDNLSLAKNIQKLIDRVNVVESDAKKALDVALDCQAVYKDHESRLRAIEGQPKSEPKAKARTVPFRQFKAAVEWLPEED